MVNVNNYSTRNMPSVHYGRTNIWNRYANHAQAARDASVFNNSCGCHNHCAPPPMPMAGFGFSPFGFGGFGMGGFGLGGIPFGGGCGNTNVNVNLGPSNEYAAGNVIGMGIGLCTQYSQQIGGFFKNLFGKNS